MGEASAPASLPLTPHTHSVHPLSWASLPPPAGSRSIPHTPFAHTPNWASLPFPITSTGRNLRPLSWASLPPPASLSWTPHTRSVHRLTWANLPPPASELSSKLRLNWLNFPGPQLGMPSAPNKLVIHSPYSLRVYSLRATHFFRLRFSWGSLIPPPSAGRAFRPQLACIRFLIRSVHPLSYPTFRPQIVYTNFTYELVGFSTVSYMYSIKGVCCCASVCAE